MQLIDHAGPPPAPGSYPAGVRGALRYIAPRNADGSRRSKCITPAEVSMHRAAQHLLGLVFEDSQANCLGGAAQGDHDGAIAVAELQSLGVPGGVGVAIFAAVDRSVTAAQMPDVAAYLDAFHKHTTAAGYRRGVYGDYDVLIAMLRDGHADIGWQTVGWSGGHQDHDPRVVLFQNGQQVVLDSTTCDLNDVWRDDWGQWRPGAASPVPTPVIEHTYQEDDVKTGIVHVTLDGAGNGWSQWDPALGHAPVIVAATVNGPYPPVDGYWFGTAQPVPAAQTRDNLVVVAVSGGKPSGSLDVHVAVA